MPRILQSIHLSDYQALVMLLVKQAPSATLAFAELGEQDPRIESNLMGAKDALEDLNLIQMTNGNEPSEDPNVNATPNGGEQGIIITPEGEKVMQDEYLIDEMGEITEKGQALLEPTVKEPTPADQGVTDAPMDMAQGGSPDMAPTIAGGEMGETPGMGESSILRLINDIVKLNS